MGCGGGGDDEELVSYWDSTGLGAAEIDVVGDGLLLVSEHLLIEVLSFGLGLEIGGESAGTPVFTCCLHLARLFLNHT